MIRCHNCGTDNLDGSEYCDECGVRLRSAVDTPPPLSAPTPMPTPKPVPKPVPDLGADTADRMAPPEKFLPVESDPLPPEPPAFTTTSSTPKPATPAAPPVMDYSTPPPTPKVEPPRPVTSTSVATPSSRRATEATSHLQQTGHGTTSLHNQSSGTSSKPHAKLIITRGGSLGKEFPVVGPEAQIGRWDADNGIFPDIDLDQFDPEAKVSRRHARIIADSGQYMIEDLGSTNGTFINRGRRLIPGRRQPLRSGDELIVGKTFLKFIVEN